MYLCAFVAKNFQPPSHQDTKLHKENIFFIPVTFSLLSFTVCLLSFYLLSFVLSSRTHPKLPPRRDKLSQEGIFPENLLHFVFYLSRFCKLKTESSILVFVTILSSKISELLPVLIFFATIFLIMYFPSSIDCILFISMILKS